MLYRSLYLICILMTLAAPAYAGSVLHHELIIEINPKDATMQAEDTVTLPDGASAREWRFFLHEGMDPVMVTEGAHLARASGKPPKTISDAGVAVTAYSVTVPTGMTRFTLRYQGKIDHPIDKQKGTPGIIAEDGLYLSPEACWYPRFDVALLSFRMDIKVPDSWQAISQGDRTSFKRFGDSLVFRWDSPDPLEDIFLIGGPYVQMVLAAPVRSMIFLRKSADVALEARYLLAASSSLGTYGKWLGAYPYKKLAIVENFWERDVNRPGFILLGPKALRAPTAIKDTLPREVLSNWWGQSVYLNLDKGDWSRGLLTYMADHQALERKGQAPEFRRAALQRYTSYISAERDFPIAAYRGQNPDSDAIGEGKTMIFFHLLRMKLGDETFIKALKQFYGKYTFRHASFDDLIQTFEAASGVKLQQEYDRWVKQPGAPRIRTSKISASQQEGEQYTVKALIEQIQDGPAYSLSIPLAVYLEGLEDAYQTTVEMTDKRLELSLPVPGRPLALGVDSEYDLLRLLDTAEMPPLWSKTVQAQKALIVLPGNAPATLLDNYRKLAEALRQDRKGPTEIKLDSDITDLPADSGILLLGWENAWRERMIDALSGYDGSVSENSARIGKDNYLRSKNSVLFSGRHPVSAELAMTWVASDNPKSFAGLIDQLPQYGQYSYLAFEGDEAKNIAKGTWEGARQTFKILPATKASSKKVKFRLKPRYALGQ